MVRTNGSNGSSSEMRVALLSDIHGNVVALDAVLADMALQGPFDEIVVAGDLAWSGPWPAEVVDRVAALATRVIRGNTDAFFDVDEESAPPDTYAERFLTALAWMRQQLGPQRTAYLRSLPFSQCITPAAGHELLIVHANPIDMDQPIAPRTGEQDLDDLLGADPRWEVLAFGHVHVPFVRQWRGRMLVDVASAGLPMDGDPRAAYAILTWAGHAWRAEHRRVFYNAPVVAHEMRNGGMPRGKHFAERLMAARYNPGGQPTLAVAD
jgi:predicted phosphodiesterase